MIAAVAVDQQALQPWWTTAKQTGRPQRLLYRRDLAPLLAIAQGRVQRGGCGMVTFVDLPDGTRAAVKQLYAGDKIGMASTFMHEVSSLELLPSHSNVIKLLGHCWQCVGQYAMVFEHAPDRDLERAGVQRLISSPSLAAAVLADADAGRGLAHLHAHDIVHADVKEANILLWLHGGEVTAKLADLGLCSALQGQQFVTSGAGTPGYLAADVKSPQDVSEF